MDVGALARELGAHAARAGASPADALASLAAALGAPWDGEGDAGLDLPLPSALRRAGPRRASGPWLLDAAREALLAPADRRRLGAHHTPPEVARRLARLALSDGLPGDDGLVVDPACGGGAFLLAAADVLHTAGAGRAAVAGRLRGADLDPVAAATARAALALWAGRDEPHHGIVEADGCGVAWLGDEAGRAVGAVVGNPPFRSPLRTRDEDRAAGSGSGRGPAAYTDLAVRFLLAGVGLLAPGARLVLVQPESLLAARDAGPVRAAVLADAELEALWVAGEPVFRAGVRVCAPLLRRRAPGAAPRTSVRRYSGRAVAASGRAPAPAAGSPVSWAPLRPHGAPRLADLRRRPTLGELAATGAGFRDEFYGLAAATREARGSDDPRPPVLTVGLVEPGRSVWGDRPARIAGRRFAAPVVDRSGLDARLDAWVQARLVPKVLVATQTRVVEAAADPAGAFVPLTPVVWAVPAASDDVWRLAAALTSPEVTAWAVREHGGTGLSAGAVKLAAGQLRRAPLPADSGAWAEATARLRAGDVDGCGAVLADGRRDLLAWWRARLAPRRP